MPTTAKKVKDQVFAFDRIFDDKANQTDVYEGTTKNLLDSVLDGYNATVFAYGATGCGKTHTITGTSQHPGIIFLTMQELFEKIDERKQDKTTEVSLSYLEIYNETIRDLLVPGGSKQGLMLREDSNQAVTVAGLTSHHPKDVQEVMDMIVQGNEYRTVSPTEANATSSRSHAVLQINVAQKDRNADVNEPHTMATLSIIDLAGSERASATKNRGERLIEGANINKSLLALGSCINALCDPRKRNHIPYRNSKLTRLLKFSLGGNCKTVMIVCVSPSSAHFDETQNTLRYANRAKNIQTKVTRNVFNVNRHVKDFLVKIDEQMALINELKAQQKDSETAFFAKFRKQNDRREAVCREGIQRIRAAYDNAAQERQDKISTLKRLKSFERRIAVLSAWIAAFDAVCEAHSGGDEDEMPSSLVAIRKTARGILVELENSRHHLHQRLERCNWESAVETALQHSIRQLPEDDAGDDSQVASLQREVELLKANFGREMYLDALEQEKGADAPVLRLLLTAQFEIMTSLSDTLAMGEEEAVSHAKAIIHRLLGTCLVAASQVVKPDGPAPNPVEAFPPSKRGTPKKKRPSHLRMQVVQPQQPALVSAPPPPPQIVLSPIKASPRRRKGAAARKGVSFTPVRKKSPSKRSVRWRDDEEDGTLVDFQKTPQYDSTPDQVSPEKLVRPENPSPTLAMSRGDLSAARDSDDASSPSLEASEPTIQLAKPNRFQAGFLSKSMKARNSDSPVLVAPALSLNLAPVKEESTPEQPLRTLDGARSSNLSPPSMFMSKPSPRSSMPTILDENNPPDQGNTSTSGSDSDSSTLDARKIRSALHLANKAGPRRMSSVTFSVSNPGHKRASSAASVEGRGGPQRPAASTSNGVSRHRRNSAERRRSPPIMCSPPELSRGDRAFTAGQARRMNLGGSVRLEGGSPIKEAAEPNSRRITIGGAGPQRGRDIRAAVAWR